MLDTLIIGAGPAGLTTFYYSLLYGLNAACVGNVMGGKVLLAPHVTDYPGFPKFTGKQLIDELLRQIKEHGQEPTADEVTTVTKNGETYSVQTKSGKSYEATTIVIAAGNGKKQKENLTTKLAEQLGVETENGFIKMHELYTTSKPSVFAAGECMSYPNSIEQLISSIATGTKAAAKVFEFVKKERPPIVWGAAKIRRF